MSPEWEMQPPKLCEVSAHVTSGNVSSAKVFPESLTINNMVERTSSMARKEGNGYLEEKI